MGGIVIPSITEKPGRSLGNIFDCSLRDATAIQATIRELESWLITVKKSGLPGFKAWIYQHGILPRVLLPLLLYEVTLYEVIKSGDHGEEGQWLPPQVAGTSMQREQCNPLSSLDKEFKGSHTRGALLGLQGLESCISRHHR